MTERKMRISSRKQIALIVFGTVTILTLVPLWYVGIIGDYFRVFSSGK